MTLDGPVQYCTVARSKPLEGPAQVEEGGCQRPGVGRLQALSSYDPIEDGRGGPCGSHLRTNWMGIGQLVRMHVPAVQAFISSSAAFVVGASPEKPKPNPSKSNRPVPWTKPCFGALGF